MRQKDGLGIFVGIWLSFGLAQSAQGQDVAMADTLYKAGIAKLEAGAYKEACPLLADSLKLDKAAGTIFALADCHAFLGEIATAVQRYEDYLQMVSGMPPEKQARQEQSGRVERAKKQLEDLRPLVPAISFVLPAQIPEGTRVEKDGIELSLVSLSMVFPMNPGEHVVRVLVPGREAVETRFSAVSGEKKRVELLFPEAKIDAPLPSKPVISVPSLPRMEQAVLPERPKDSRTSGMRVGAYVALGLGAVGLGVGGTLGGIVLDGKNDVLERCPRDKTTEQMLCASAEDIAKGERTQTLGHLSTAGLIAGGVLGVTGLILLSVDLKAKRTEAPRGQIGLDILALDRRSLLLGARGGW